MTVLRRAAAAVLLLAASAGAGAGPLGIATTVRFYDGGWARESSLEWRPRPRIGAVLCQDSYDAAGWGRDWRIGGGLLCRPVARRLTLDLGPGASINRVPGLPPQLSLDATLRARCGIVFADATGLFFRDGLFCPALAGVRVRIWRTLRLYAGGGGYYATTYHAGAFTPALAAGASYGL